MNTPVSSAYGSYNTIFNENVPGLAQVSQTMEAELESGQFNPADLVPEQREKVLQSFKGVNLKRMSKWIRTMSAPAAGEAYEGLTEFLEKMDTSGLTDHQKSALSQMRDLWKRNEPLQELLDDNHNVLISS